ncbi:hypothetical protein B7P43_G09966 [Cryptotermes secundus]|uniref:Spaetzle domain-containing protein n=1 Tax=Cryptotermes secundus TaxID=105785 RepID=A0A2J7PUF4_9NEOP|nr:hypothetical protein B7P43_G09966 [Cryptotermes secundus]
MATGCRALLFVGLLVVTSEPRPHKYENIALPRTYGISSETSPQNYYDRTSYRSVRNDQNASQYMDNSGGSKIIFPGEPEGYSVPKFTPEVSGQQPKCADEDGFCESADNYPVDYVRRIFQNEANSYIFGSDLMDVNLRINPDEEVSLCPSMEQVVYPKVAQNKDDKWLYIINQETYFQGIRIEKCAKQGSCTFAENFPNGYTTSCQQKYIYRKLIALGEDGRPVTDSFRLPSCCSCVVTKSFRSRRMASDLGKSQIPSKRRRRR